jgi:hypothetical protein
MNRAGVENILYRTAESAAAARGNASRFNALTI